MPQTVTVDIIDHYPDWMSKAYAALENVSLHELPLAGSHDAGAYDISTGSQAQGANITTQLACGFRYFDFRVCVNNGVFYAVHGAATTNNNYAAIASRRDAAFKETGKQFIFDDIKNFCKSHPKELVILHFSHFVGSGSQKFSNRDEKDFAQLIREYFSGMLIPRHRWQSYGDCIRAGQQVVAIVDDDATWYPGPSDNAGLWSTKDCFKDRYSNKYFDITGGAAFNNLQAKIDYTLQDQEDYLMRGGSDHRDPHKFWVTQAVLNYSAVPYQGHSQNYHGAKVMNPQFRKAYGNWRQGRRKDGTPDSNLRKPNILLMDYAGHFLGPKLNDPLHLF
ncbi:MAG: protein 1-like [Bryobacterales bacterium]|nr:protein 1-like [Bryobacterales bacterium]